jgi:hypothetical protein
MRGVPAFALGEQVNFEKAYLTLRDAVADTMREDELPQWEDSAYGGPMEGREERRLELLQGYLMHVKAERNVPQTLNDAAITQHEMMSSWVKAGFTREEAMVMLQHTMSLQAGMHHGC